VSATCYMLAELGDLWEDGGGQRVGAMTWWSHEREPHDAAPRPMPHLAVMTPAGLVCLDCPATDPPHGYWTRTGEPPSVTVTPSLNISEGEPTAWHGFLAGGVLTP
jgi:hypothetical protein